VAATSSPVAADRFDDGEFVLGATFPFELGVDGGEGSTVTSDSLP
jgi:hypothetical protein